ncbi:hypothetical protein V9K67_26780 [Paraflavisolibacter sp. H34]|uniref:hypothetical protein n=1 Tax=Huijunlia imazamoxiresistens TaxID=3127457 RepID=UPI003018D284
MSYKSFYLSRSICFVIYILSFSFAFSQKTNTEKNISNQVFTLSTCDTTSLLYSNTTGRTATLSASSRALTTLRITGINPLRYKFFLNNEAISHFMETSAIPITINNFLNGDYTNIAPEIKIPEIFKVDSITSKLKVKVRAFQDRIKYIKDTLIVLRTDINNRYNMVYDSVIARGINNGDTVRINDRAYQATKTDQKRLALLRLFDNYSDKLELILVDYQSFTGNLPLNNPAFEVLARYREINLEEESRKIADKDVMVVLKMQKQFGDDYLMHDQRFKWIDKQMDNINRNFTSIYDATLDATINRLIDTLRYYNFSWPDQKRTYFSSFNMYPSGYRLSNPYNDNIVAVKEMVLNKRFQLYEEFVLNTATMIGVLVQNKFGEYSRYNNRLLNLRYVTPEMLNEIKSKSEKLRNTFEFVQKTSAELQVLVSYLDINTELYESIAKRINTNYVFLLQYLKNLDFVANENETPLFTLPSSTNVNNVDL